MENRIVEKRIKLAGRDFIITKFTPFFGVWLALQTFSGIAGKKDKLNAMVSFIMNKPQEEFEKLQKDVLSYVYEVLPVGRVKLIDENGNFAVESLDSPAVLNLFIQTIMFSMMDFFGQGVMESLQAGIESSITPLLKK